MDLKDKLILVVEGDEVMRRYVSQVLIQLLGVDEKDIMETNDGNLALETLRTWKAGLIISGQKMTELSGLDFLQKVRETDKETPFILMSGDISTKQRNQALGVGANFVILKPFSPKELEALIKRL